MEKNCLISSFLIRATHWVLRGCVAACMVQTSMARPRLLLTLISNLRSSSLFTTSRRHTWFICCTVHTVKCFSTMHRKFVCLSLCLSCLSYPSGALYVTRSQTRPWHLSHWALGVCSTTSPPMAA